MVPGLVFFLLIIKYHFTWVLANENPAIVPYSQLPRIIFASHGVPSAGMKNPEYVSAQHRCLNKFSRPSHDLKDAYPFLPQKEYSDENVPAILTALHS